MSGSLLGGVSITEHHSQHGTVWRSQQPFHLLMDHVPLTQEFQKELSQWRKDPSGSKKKPKYSYKTVEELKAKGRISKKLTAPQKELSQVKVGAHRCPPWMGVWETRSYPTHQRRSPEHLLVRLLRVFCAGAGGCVHVLLSRVAASVRSLHSASSSPPPRPAPQHDGAQAPVPSVLLLDLEHGWVRLGQVTLRIKPCLCWGQFLRLDS